MHLIKEFKKSEEDMNKYLNELKRNNKFLSAILCESKPVNNNIKVSKMCLYCLKGKKIRVLPPWSTFIISKSRIELPASLLVPFIVSCL